MASTNASVTSSAKSGFDYFLVVLRSLKRTVHPNTDGRTSETDLTGVSLSGEELERQYGDISA